MSQTERHPSNNVVPMFRRQPTIPVAVKPIDIILEARRLTVRLLELADIASPEELGYLAFRTRQTANDIDYKDQQLNMAERLPPADAYTSEKHPMDPDPDEWLIEITLPSTLGEAA
jgi:hypothetical protein